MINSNNDNLKLWAGIILVLLLSSPFIIKMALAVRDHKPIKNDITSYRYYRH